MAVLEKAAPGTRTIVTLRPSAQRKLKQFAAKEGVSSSEIINRSLDAYQSLEVRIRKQEEEKLMKAFLKVISETYGELNASLVKTNGELDALHRKVQKLSAK